MVIKLLKWNLDLKRDPNSSSPKLNPLWSDQDVESVCRSSQFSSLDTLQLLEQKKTSTVASPIKVAFGENKLMTVW